MIICRRELARRGYRDYNDSSNGGISSVEAISIILNSSDIDNDDSSLGLMTDFDDQRCFQNECQFHHLKHQISVLSPFYRNVDQYNESLSTIVIYQNKNSYTGGTTALLLLAEELMTLGYHVHICNDTNNDSSLCRFPDRKLKSSINNRISNI